MSASTSGTAATKGPWEFRQDCLTERDGCGYIVGADGDDLSHHGNTHRSIEENLANARLIAAAPELYEALLRAREVVNAVVLSTHSVSFDADLRAIDTALSKANGEQA